MVEWGALVDNLRECQKCHTGPLQLSNDTIVKEAIYGLGGYLHVRCLNCETINLVAYGKTHREAGQRKGRPCFVVNTKLGTGLIRRCFTAELFDCINIIVAMIDSIGGAAKVNNFLSTLNIKPISQKNLAKMEQRAGETIVALSKEISEDAAREAFDREIE